MATGDISTITIRADGWSADVKVLGFTTGETFSFGDPIAGTAKFALTVTTVGYDASAGSTTPARLVWATHVVRKPYPSNASNDETVSGSDIVVRVALSEWVRAGDTVVANVAAGCFVNSGGGAQTSNAAAGLSCTNSSTATHPAAFGQWAVRPYERWQANPTLAVTARHREGVAAVQVILTDGTNTVTTAATRQMRKRALTGLYAEEWVATPSLSTLTQNAAITARFKIFPAIGDSGSVCDSNAATANDDNRTLGICNYPFWNDKSAALDSYAVVNFSTGNDTTGVSSSTLATAAASPYATIDKAITVGTANVIYVRAGTGAFPGATVTAPASKGYWRRVLPYPGDGTVVLTIAGITAWATPHLSVENCTIRLVSGSNQWLDGSNNARYLAFSGCTFDANGITSNLVSVTSYEAAQVFLTGCTMDDAYKWGWGANFAARMGHWLDGCVINCGTPSYFTQVHRIVGCAMNGMGAIPVSGLSGSAPYPDPFFMEFNKVMKLADTANYQVALAEGSQNIVTGLSIVGNVFELIAGSQPVLWISADGNSSTTNHAILWHNTLAGQRLNGLYNETGTTALTKKNSSFKFNAFWQTAIKADLFGTPSGNRIGNWADLYGVGHEGNWEQSNSLTFGNEFFGIGSPGAPTSPGGSVTGVAAYAGDASLTGTSSGGGDYTPGSSSALSGKVGLGRSVVLADLTGRPIHNGGRGCAGALQRRIAAPAMIASA